MGLMPGTLHKGMQLDYLKVDDFFKDFETERNAALSSPFETVDHHGIDYPGIYSVKDDAGFDRISDLLKLSDRGYQFIEKMSMYRTYRSDMKQNTWIHCDVQLGSYSCIVFLNDDSECNGGVAFWRHKAFDWLTHPDMETQTRLGIDQRHFDLVHQDGFNESCWEMVDYFPAKPNRAVIFRSDMYHSRYPKEQSNRLIKVYFGKVAPIEG